MTAALGPYGEYIDIRGEDVFQVWQKRAGLRCLVCGRPAEIYHSSVKNPFVRHGKGYGPNGTAAQRRSARETFLHYRFKYWVRDELRACGVAAEVEVDLGARRPDVFGSTSNGRSYAVEVQWSDLDYEGAALRTAEQQTAGVHEVVWLTRNCDWVSRLPALGIASFTPTGSDYRAHTGFLTYDPGIGMAVTEVSVREVLKRWVAGELAWANKDHTQAGWATVTDWKLYTAAQADTIKDLQERLTSTQKARDSFRATIKTQATQLETKQNQIDNQARFIVSETHRADNAEAESSRLTGELDTARARLTHAEQRVTTLTTKLDRQAGNIDAATGALKWRARMIWVLLTACTILLIIVIA
ncbi:hypothetical protein ACFXO9_27285 [Nocardia tengchongensis]|uniref:hypothetical protein n=1 Tax=Nocardia tengchongensis TaxID=2055889 RepID=UPI0036748F3C